MAEIGSNMLLLSFLFSLLLILTPNCEASGEKVYLVPINGVVDLGLSGFIKRSTEEAKDAGAKAIIFELDTPGGRVDAAEEILEHIRAVEPILTIAFINDEASSAGAFISFGCDKIVMSPGSSIGSAEPRSSIGATSEGTDEKYVSDFRSKFKSIAEENNHSGNLAQKMVDKDVELKKVKIKGETFILTAEELEEKKKEFKEDEIVIEAANIGFQKGKLLNLTAKEAVELKLSEAELKDIKEVLSYFGLKDAVVTKTFPTWSEVLVRFLTHPIVSSMLLTLGFLGLIFEFRTPGWGIIGTLGLLLLALFFWGHYLIGLANWMEILLFLLGVIALLVEIFVIPGFGIIGVSGIILILLSIFLSLLKHGPFEVPQTELKGAFYIVSISFISAFLILLASIKFLSSAPFWKGLILEKRETREEGFTSAPSTLQDYVGRVGKTLSFLRPSGRAIFGKEILDVVTEGDFIEEDKEIKIIKVEGAKFIVSRV